MANKKNVKNSKAPAKKRVIDRLIAQFPRTYKNLDLKGNLPSLSIRLVLAAVFFITGFNYSNTVFFRENPLFGIPFFAEYTISLAFALFGFHTVPIIFLKIKGWFEEFIAKTVYQIVSDFWEEQTKRMAQSRRDRDKKKTKQKDDKMKEQLSNAIFLDTSVLVDGRILDIVKTGFVGEQLVIPRVVIDELHLISDNSNDLKRARGRRGLDVVKELKKSAKVTILKHESLNKGADKDLVVLAKKCKAKLMTLDFNLNKVATIEGVQVLNINELANAVKSVYIPGESLNVKVVQKGKGKHQGVAYLDDGTMIVIKDGDNLVGDQVEVEVSKIIQTDAGKMLFAEKVN